MKFLNKCCTIVCICLVYFNANESLCTTAPVILKDGNTINISLLNYNVNLSSTTVVEKAVDIGPYITVTINVVQIPVDASFVLIQIHSYKYSVTLSYRDVITPHYYVNGTNIGLVQVANAGSSGMTFFIHHENDGSIPSILIFVQAYGKEAPIPGGCNMEFSVETAPYLSLRYSESVVVMEAQPAALSTTQRICSFPSPVELDMYHVYLPERDFSEETYFDFIRKMMTVKGIQENGRRVPTATDGHPLRRVYSAYPGTGSVFAVVARSGFSTSASAYVPTLTYACNTHSWNVDTCDVSSTPFSKVLCAMALFLGLFTCFFGHRFFRSEMFLIGFMTGGTIAYILFTLQNIFTTSLVITIAVVIGIITGTLWVLFWSYFGIPVISVLLPTMTLGYVAAAVAMYAGLGDMNLLQKDINFWSAFVCVLLIVPLLSMSSIHKANIVTCAILGAYAFIIPIDHYIGSNLKFIIMNTVRRATVEEFRSAVIDPPFQVQDLLLTLLWLSLALVGTCVQLFQQRGKPPFPPPVRDDDPYGWRPFGESWERTPLMTDVHSTYNSVSDDFIDHSARSRIPPQATAPPLPPPPHS